MTRLVVLTASTAAVPDGYTVRLGPLAFITPADTVSETIGDGLEAVGAALVPTDRRPRPLKLKLPVRGDRRQIDWDAVGRRLRRQSRAYIDNARWRLQGAYLTWDADPDLDGWIMLGGADLSEADPGVSFGEFEMDLSDVYIVGRPGTHRPGRRAVIGDRRGGLVPRDTRRLLYATDFATQALPTEPLVVPGDVVDLVASGNRPVASTVAGPLRSARRLWRACAASDGEIVSYQPDEVVVPGRTRYLDVDDLGSVRVWDLSAAAPYPPDPATYTTERDTHPDRYWGWERVLGDVLTPNKPLAIDNGVCRLIWLGPAANQGLAVEVWDDTIGHYRRVGRVLHALNVREQRVVELTAERAVVEWRAGQYAMRAILQRGWWGPRLESYDDGGGTARLEYAYEEAAGLDATVTSQTPSWVRSVTPYGTVARSNRSRNPDAEVDTSTWAAFGSGQTATIDRVTVAPISGSASFHVLAGQGGVVGGRFIAYSDAPVSPGEIIAARMTHRPYNFFGGYLNMNLQIDWVAAGGAILGSSFGPTVGIPDGNARDVTIAGATAPAGAAWARVYHIVNVLVATGAGAPEYLIDKVLIEPVAHVGDQPGAYFDGASGGLARWTGAAHLSTSEILDHAAPAILWASGMNDEVIDALPTVVTGHAMTARRTRVLVAQIAGVAGPTAAQLAALSLADAQSIPVLVGRR